MAAAQQHEEEQESLAATHIQDAWRLHMRAVRVSQELDGTFSGDHG